MKLEKLTKSYCNQIYNKWTDTFNSCRAGRMDDASKTKCETCDGKGVVLTEKGQELIDFLREWL